MKKYIAILGITLLAVGCQKTVTNENSDKVSSALQETNLESATLPEIKKDLLLYSPFTRDGGKSNLFLHNGNLVTPYLPAGYYYVPATARNDIKPALLPTTLLVQKGTELSFFNTGNQSLQAITGFSVPTWAEVRVFYSITGGETLLIALVERNQLTATPHASLLYRVNLTTGVAENVANPLKDNLSAESNRFPIIGAIYDAQHNRIMHPMFVANTGYRGIENFNLTTRQRFELLFSEISNISLTGPYLTVQSLDQTKAVLSVMDLQSEQLVLRQLSLPTQNIYPSNDPGRILHTYVGNNYVIALNFGSAPGDIVVSILKEQNDALHVIHNIRLPYAIELKRDSDNLYVFTSTAPGSQRYQVGIYNFATNSFTGRITLPADVSGGETEFVK